MAAGVLVALRGAGWSGLTRRYDDATASGRAGEPVDLWRALDRGEDPTRDSAPRTDAPTAQDADRPTSAGDLD
jgi:hypothetical protein